MAMIKMKKCLAMIMLCLMPTLFHVGQIYAVGDLKEGCDQKVETFLGVIRDHEPKEPGLYFGTAYQSGMLWRIAIDLESILARVRASLQQQVVRYSHFQRIAFCIIGSHGGKEEDKTVVHTKVAFWQALAALDIEELDFCSGAIDVRPPSANAIVIPDTILHMKSLKTLKFNAASLKGYNRNGEIYANVQNGFISLAALKMFERIEFSYPKNYALQYFEQQMPEGYKDCFDRKTLIKGEWKTLILTRKAGVFEE